MTLAPSLFDVPAEPVLGSVGEWITSTLSGSVAVSLRVIAVAFLGVLLMSGRLAIREGLRVAIGCFLLLGAPLIATGLLEAAGRWGIQTLEGPSGPEPSTLPANLPPANYDPYAGASLRSDEFVP